MVLPIFAACLALAGLAVAKVGRRSDLPLRLEPQRSYQFALDTGRTNLTEELGGLKKRGFNGKGSFYAVGLGACGITNRDSDYIVALNFQQYGDPNAISPYCFKEITITYGGKSAQAQIVDACESCGYGGIDLSPSLFSHFADQSVGIIYLDWSVGGGSAAPTTKATPTSTYKAPTTTWTPPSSTWTPDPTTSAWTPTTTWTPPATTSSWSSPAAVAVVSSLSSKLASSSLASSSARSSIALASGKNSTVSSTAASTASSTPAEVVAPPTNALGGNIDGLNQLVIQLGSLVGAAAQNA